MPGPSFNELASFLSPAESMICTSEEIYGGGNSTVSSAYPAPDHQMSYHLGNELRPGAASGNGVWNSPTAPGACTQPYADVFYLPPKKNQKL